MGNSTSKSKVGKGHGRSQASAEDGVNETIPFLSYDRDEQPGSRARPSTGLNSWPPMAGKLTAIENILSQGMLFAANFMLFAVTMARKMRSNVTAWKEKFIELGANLRDSIGGAIAAITNLDIFGKVKKAKKWARENPKEATVLALSIIIPMICVACTPAILGGISFTASGIAAGSMAAGIQAGIGNVMAGSTFAILKSAGMGGVGVSIISGMVFSVANAAVWGMAASHK